MMASDLPVLLCLCVCVYTNMSVLCKCRSEEAKHAWVDVWCWDMSDT